jgi:hypothetical protein
LPWAFFVVCTKNSNFISIMFTSSTAGSSTPPVSLQSIQLVNMDVNMNTPLLVRSNSATCTLTVVIFWCFLSVPLTTLVLWWLFIGHSFHTMPQVKQIVTGPIGLLVTMHHVGFYLYLVLVQKSVRSSLGGISYPKFIQLYWGHWLWHLVTWCAVALEIATMIISVQWRHS